MNTTRTIVVILGPTAVGKSALSIQLAKKFRGVVISADSRQVYRGMDLGTGKITQREMAGVPHYLLDIASPTRQYSVSRYVHDVLKVLKIIPSSTPIFLVGGSPFYIDALTKPDSYSPVPPDPKLRQQLAKKTLRQLQATLRHLDPKRYKSIDIANRRRLERAIEIASYGGNRKAPTLPPMRILKIGLSLPRTILNRRIDHRVDVRLRQGMVAEVRRLHETGVSWPRLDNFGLEYRFLGRYLRGQISKTEAVNQLKSATHDFAKRQMTWWKRDHDICWVSNQNHASSLLRAWLKKS